MLKVVLTITQTLISIYWAGGMARQNSAIDEVIELVEEGYMLFNSIDFIFCFFGFHLGCSCLSHFLDNYLSV
jgi:hypothetical protein